MSLFKFLVYATLTLALIQFAVCVYADILLDGVLKRLPTPLIADFRRFRRDSLANRLLIRKAVWMQQAAAIAADLQPDVAQARRLIGWAFWLALATVALFCAAYLLQTPEAIF